MYVVRQLTGSRKPVFHTGESLSSWFPRKVRDTGRRPGGMFREVEDAGQDKSRLALTLTGGVRSGGGTLKSTSTEYDRLRLGEVRSTAAEVGKAVRVLLPEDVDRLAEKDGEIAGLEEALKNLRGERREIIAAAWARAEKMPTVTTLMAMAAAR